ncbi:MAG: TRAP transporter substrate-binding protein [Alphaproteobacteria bacterium]|nr:TRAP transporter substrate-binding protein [Alphaproteobacteria bacterium]
MTAEAQQRIPKTDLNAIGNISITTQFRFLEKPFWAEKLPQLTGGQVTANFKGWNEMGLKGPEVFRLVQQGVAHFGTSQLGFVSGDAAINDAPDLAGLSTNIDDFRANYRAFKPILEEYYAKNFGLKILTIQSFQSQILYCRDKIDGLKDLKGRKVRVSGAALSDFIDHFGGSGVNLAFTEVQQALEKGVIDCSITGTLGGYSAKWYEAAKYLYTLPFNFAAGMTVVNVREWEKLHPELRQIIETNIKTMEDAMWALNKQEDEVGINCNTGGQCPEGPPAKMVRVNPSAEDLELRRKAMLETVLPRWSKRCGAGCAEQFNSTIGKITGLTAPSS